MYFTYKNIYSKIFLLISPNFLNYKCYEIQPYCIERRRKMTMKTNWSTALFGKPFEGITTNRIDQGNLTIYRYTIESHASFPLHRHPEEQTVVVINGSCTLRTDEKSMELGVGDLVHSVSMEPHGITAGDNGVVFLNIITPRRTEDRTEYLEKYCQQ
jgi:quercetin dioxygenase-like cupin family protein